MRLILKEKLKEIDDIQSFIWEPEEKLEWKPGQFLVYTLEQAHPDERGVERYFTISSAPYEGIIRLTTRMFDKRSTFKEGLSKLAIGTAINAEGPKGKFFIEDFKSYYVLIGGGIGVTPYRSMIAQFKHDQNRLKGLFIYQNKDKDFLFQELFDSFTKENKDFRVLYQLEEITPETILEEIPVGTKPVFYVSGPEGMVEHYEKMLLTMGFSDEQIKRDYFSGYPWPL